MGGWGEVLVGVWEVVGLEFFDFCCEVMADVYFLGILRC